MAPSNHHVDEWPEESFDQCDSEPPEEVDHLAPWQITELALQEVDPTHDPQLPAVIDHLRACDECRGKRDALVASSRAEQQERGG